MLIIFIAYSYYSISRVVVFVFHGPYKVGRGIFLVLVTPSCGSRFKTIL